MWGHVLIRVFARVQGIPDADEALLRTCLGFLASDDVNVIVARKVAVAGVYPVYPLLVTFRCEACAEDKQSRL